MEAESWGHKDVIWKKYSGSPFLRWVLLNARKAVCYLKKHTGNCSVSLGEFSMVEDFSSRWSAFMGVTGKLISLLARETHQMLWDHPPLLLLRFILLKHTCTCGMTCSLDTPTSTHRSTVGYMQFPRPPTLIQSLRKSQLWDLVTLSTWPDTHPSVWSQLPPNHHSLCLLGSLNSSSWVTNQRQSKVWRRILYSWLVMRSC